MQSLAVINKELTIPPSAFKYYGDLQFYQTSHLPCKQNVIDIRYNSSSFDYVKPNYDNLIDFTLGNYFMRESKCNVMYWYYLSLF